MPGYGDIGRELRTFEIRSLLYRLYHDVIALFCRYLVRQCVLFAQHRFVVERFVYIPESRTAESYVHERTLQSVHDVGHSALINVAGSLSLLCGLAVKFAELSVFYQSYRSINFLAID